MNRALKSYEDAMQVYGDDIQCQVGSATIYPEKRIIDRDEALSLATLDLPDVFIGPAGGYAHEPPKVPTGRIQLEEVVLYGGYPGVLREAGERTAVFPFQSFAWAVADVSDRNMAMNLAFKDLHWPGHEGEQINEDIGGMSGGPVYRVVEGKVDRLELVGVIYEQYVTEEVVITTLYELAEKQAGCGSRGFAESETKPVNIGVSGVIAFLDLLRIHPSPREEMSNILDICHGDVL